MLQDLLEDCGGLSWNAAGSDCSSDSESTGYVTASGRKQKFLSTKLLRKQIWSNAKSIGQEYDDEVYGRFQRMNDKDTLRKREKLLQAVKSELHRSETPKAKAASTQPCTHDDGDVEATIRSQSERVLELGRRLYGDETLSKSLESTAQRLKEQESFMKGQDSFLEQLAYKHAGESHFCA
eukprot:794469-Rhodomonas_salina.1